jgi:hypothetical protein
MKLIELTMVSRQKKTKVFVNARHIRAITPIGEGTEVVFDSELVYTVVEPFAEVYQLLTGKVFI